MLTPNLAHDMDVRTCASHSRIIYRIRYGIQKHQSMPPSLNHRHKGLRRRLAFRIPCHCRESSWRPYHSSNGRPQGLRKHHTILRGRAGSTHGRHRVTDLRKFLHSSIRYRSSCQHKDESKYSCRRNKFGLGPYVGKVGMALRGMAARKDADIS